VAGERPTQQRRLQAMRGAWCRPQDTWYHGGVALTSRQAGSPDKAHGDGGQAHPADDNAVDAYTFSC
jgi:hypothetical protein